MKKNLILASLTKLGTLITKYIVTKNLDFNP